MSINFTKIGRLTKVEITGQSTQYYETFPTKFNFTKFEDGSGKLIITITPENKSTITYYAPSVTDIKVGGVALTNQADFDSKMAEVFPDVNSSSDGTGQFTLSEVTVLKNLVIAYTTNP